MEDYDPQEDFRSPTAAILMDVAFGLNGMARHLAAEAKKEEERERKRQNKRAQRDRARLTAASEKRVA